MKVITKYEAKDGMVFPTEEECRAYESNLYDELKTYEVYAKRTEYYYCKVRAHDEGEASELAVQDVWYHEVDSESYIERLVEVKE